MDIGIIIVTYNRLADLKITLDAYEKQTYHPSYVMVIDNHSTDGTDEFLRAWRETPSAAAHKVVTMEENTGGSGGFERGMREALQTDCEWIFVADDDAVPDAQMLEKLVTFAESHPEEMRDVAALCTSVNNHGRREGIHRCRLSRSILGYWEKYVPESEYDKEYFALDFYSFVGTMIRRGALEKAGVARGDFFIYNDDYEHAVRVGKVGRILCVPASVMYHVDNLNYEKKATWRDYYGTRNAVIMHLEHFGRWGGFSRAARRMLVAYSTMNREKISMFRTAISDAYQGKTGIHDLYRPGWQPTK